MGREMLGYFIMAGSIEARRRWFGAFYVIVAGGMLIWGQTVLKSTLESDAAAFLIYWLVCFLFTGMAMITALLDLRSVRRRAREQQRRLLVHTLEEIEQERQQRCPDGGDDPANRH
jgi:hypothetical protein